MTLSDFNSRTLLVGHGCGHCHADGIGRFESYWKAHDFDIEHTASEQVVHHIDGVFAILKMCSDA